METNGAQRTDHEIMLNELQQNLKMFCRISNWHYKTRHSLLAREYDELAQAIRKILVHYETLPISSL